MGYPRTYGCCCADCCESPDFGFLGGIPEKFKSHPTDAVFRYPEFPARQLLLDSDGTSTPAASYYRRVRRCGTGYRVGAMVASVESWGGVTIDPQQVGIFIANAYALWIDFPTQTLQFAPTDATGTIDQDAATVIYEYPGPNLTTFTGAQLFIMCHRLPDGDYNVHFGDWGNLIQDVVYGIYGVSPSGLLDERHITIGFTATAGGAAWSDLQTACDPYAVCSCIHGTALQWTVTTGAVSELPGQGTSSVVQWPTIQEMHGQGGLLTSCCAWFGGNVAIPEEVLPVDDPYYTFPSLPSGAWLLFPEASGDGSSYMTLVFQYGATYFRPGMLSPISLTVAAVVYRVRMENFLCYCEVTLQRQSVASYFFCPGFTSGPRPVLQLGVTWPETITLTPDLHGATDLPCAVECEWISRRNGATHVLEWHLVNGNCSLGHDCIEPAFAPTTEFQTATTGCAT